MSFPGRTGLPPGMLHLVSAVACSTLLAACISSTESASARPTPSPSDGATPGSSAGPTATGSAGPTAQPEPTPSGTLEAGLERVPTACVGLGERDCRRVVAHVATLLTADQPEIGYVQVGPFGCPTGQGCPTTLAARPHGEITLESAGGAIAFQIRANGADIEARPQELFVVDLPPTSQPPTPASPQPFTLGHCGLWSGIDLGGSWWDPVGVVDYDHPDAINAAEGTFAPLGPDRAIFTSESGFTVQLIRRNGSKSLPLCD